MNLESQEPVANPNAKDPNAKDPNTKDPNTKDPRAAQKSRTRSALLEAARQISAAGGVLTVMGAADKAGISKATAYRYFTDPGTLAREAALDLAVLIPEDIVGDSSDIRVRVHRAARYFRDFPRQHETAFRQFIARTMDNWLTAKETRPLIRGGRRIPAFELALHPVAAEMDPRAFRQLVLALSSSATGFEQHLAMTDVCGLDPHEADEIAHEVVEALLDRFLPPGR